MQGKRLRQGKVTVINKKRGKVDCVPCNLVPRSIGTTQWVRGTLSLFAVPACYFRSNPPKNIFIFISGVLLQRPLVPRMSPTPTEPCTALSTFPSTPPSCLTPPFPPQPTQDDPRPKPLAAPTTTSSTIFLAPLPPTTLKEGHFPQLPPSLLHHLPDFRDRHKFGKQKLYVRSLQAELSSSNGKSVSENCGDLDKR